MIHLSLDRPNILDNQRSGIRTEDGIECAKAKLHQNVSILFCTDRIIGSI